MTIFTITLKASQTPQRVGTPVSIAVEVRNVSDQPVWIVGVVDGSEEGIRYPRYSPQVTLAGEVVARPPAPEDPLVGPLRLVDFRRLKAGEAFDPTARSSGAAYLPISTFSNFLAVQPGRYQFSLVLSTESQSPEQWLGRFGQDAERAGVLERIAIVPRQTIRSNLLEVQFT